MVKHIILSILMFICSLSIYSDVPNEIITKNPKKEVTTVNSEKNRDHANMSITVNKINLIDIEGVEVDKSIIFSVPQEKEQKKIKDKYIVINSLDLLNNYINPLKSKRNIEDLNIISPRLIRENDKEKVFRIDKGNKENYILKINENNAKIEKVFRIKNKLATKNGLSYEVLFPNAGYVNKGDIHWIEKDLIAGKEYHGGKWWSMHLKSYNNQVYLRDEYIRYNSPLDGTKDKNLVYVAYIKFNAPVDAFRGAVGLPQASRLQKPLRAVEWAGPSHAVESYIENTWYVDWIDGKWGENSVEGVANKYKVGTYFMPDMNLTLGTYHVLGMILRNFDTPEYENLHIDSPYEVTRPPEETTIKILKETPLNLELNPVSNQYLEVNNLKEDLSYVTRSNNSRIRLEVIGDGVTKEDVSTKTTKAFILEKNGCRIKIEYKQNTGQGAKPIITKLTDANSEEIFKLKVSMLSEDLSKELNGGDILIIKVEPKPPIDIGTFIFKLDRRILSDKSDLNWIYSNGNITRRIINYSQNNYKEFVTVIDNLKNLSSVKAIDVLEVEGRPIRFNSFTSADNGKEYRNYLAHEIPDYRDEAAIPYEMPLSELSKYFIVSRNNGSLLDNKFKLLGEDQKIYIGNVKEEYIGDNAFESSGEIDLTSLNIGEYASWNQYGQSGNLTNTSGVQGKTIVLKMIGNLFNLKSALNLSGNHIVTKLKVIKNGIIQEKNGNIGEKIEVENEDNIIGIDEKGFYIHKKTSKSIPIDYKIEAYYNEILLGSLDLTVLNNKETSIGEVILKLDSRVREGLTPIWFNSKKKASQGVSGQQTDYQEVVKVEGNYIKLEDKTITRVESVEGKKFNSKQTSVDNIEYSIFTKDAKPDINPSAIPTNINLQDLKDNLMIARDRKQDRLDGNNKFKVQTEDNTLYSGNIKEDYIGEYAIKGRANVDLTTLDLNDFVGWNQVGQSGSLQNTMGTEGKTITLEGQLFNWKSALNPNGNHIVNRLVVKKGNEQPSEVTGSIGNPIQIENEDNIIGISNEGLYVQKKSYNNKRISYLIQGYYNDIFLGEIRLTILNNKEVNIGKIDYYLDRRIYTSKGEWIFTNGDNYDRLYNMEYIGNIYELMDVKGDFSKLENISIKDVIDIKGYGRVRYKEFSVNNLKYILYSDTSSPIDIYKDESAMPINLNLQELKENILVSKFNFEGRDIQNNEFILRGENGVLYSGNVKETYRGEDSLYAKATLDMKSGKLKTEGIWVPKSKGNVKSIGETPYILKITEGKLFNTKGLKGEYSIVTRLVVKEKGIEVGRNEGDIKEDRKVELKDNIIGVNSNGNFYVGKLTHTHEEKNYEIEIYYREILLGKLDLKVENGYGFAIIDGDNIDFGDLFPGDIKEGVTTIEVTNPLNAKINVELAPDSKNEMYLEGSPINSKTTIPIKKINITSIKGSGRDISSFKMSATAVTNKENYTGYYNGELEVVITIIP